MNSQFRAIREVHEFFSREKIPYVLIGGIALQFWGEPRFTRDVDVTILVSLGDEETTVRKILSFFQPRITDALQFALENRICLVKNKEGYEIDISLGIPGYEEEVIKRSVNCEIEKGYPVRICSAEDLIIHKAIAGRPQDISDIEGIIIRQGNKLEVDCIHKWLNQFSSLLEMPEMLERFDGLWKKLTQ